MNIDKVGLLVCGSRTIGGYNNNAEYTDGPYRYYTNQDHLSMFEYWMDRIVASVIRFEKKENVSFDKSDILIIEGGAVGPDNLASIWAHKNHINYIEMPAQWSLYGKSAGYKRNVQMLNLSKYVLALYDGVSKGTLHTITEAKKRKLKVKTVIFP